MRRHGTKDTVTNIIYVRSKTHGETWGDSTENMRDFSEEAVA